MKRLIFALLVVLCGFNGYGQIITTFAGNGTLGYSGDGGAATAAELYAPWGVAVDGSGNVYIADQLNNRIRKVDPSGFISTFAGNGTLGYSGDGGAATAAELRTPTGVAVDGSGNVYIADNGNSRIRKVDPTGVISTFAGNGTYGYSGDGGAATAAHLYGPFVVAFDGAGNVYIADCYNSRIRKVDPSGVISTFAGNGTLGYSGDGGAATDAQLVYPFGVAVDGSGNVYIADANNSRIRKVDPTGVISTFAGNGTYGYSGDGGAATAAELSSPVGVSVDGGGNVYIADYYNNLIRKVDLSGVISTIAGNGTLGYSGDGGAATAAELNYPTGVAVDGGGNVYIADQYNYRIRKVSGGSPSGGTIIGDSTVCAGLYITLTDTTSGGTWMATNGHATVASGVVTGVSAGVDTIRYSVTNSFGTALVTKVITVSPLPSAGSISGASSVCISATTTLTDSVSGGTWSSSNTSVATVSTTGVVTGVTAGVDTISYTVTNSCGSASTTMIVTVTTPVSSLPCYVPSSGLIAWYPFTGNANDSSGNSINGIVSGASLTTDRFGNANAAYSLNGTTDYIEIPYSPLFDNPTYSFSFWVKTPISTPSYGGPGVNSGIIARNILGGPISSPDDANNWVIFECGGTCAIGTAGHADGMGVANAQTFPSISDNIWHHVVFTVSSNLCVCYKDGVKTDSNYYTVPITYQNLVTRIGRSLHTYWRAFQGQFDDFGIWSRVLTPCEISQLYNASCASVTAGTLTGSSTVCAGGTITLIDTTSGGTWSSSNTSVATVGSTGVVSGVSGGTTTISYTVSNACGSATATKVVTVNTALNNYIITTVAGTGTAGYSGDGGAATSAELNTTQGIVFDSIGNMFFVDYGNNRIRKINTSGSISTIAGNGTAGYGGDGGLATSAILSSPVGIAIDHHGNILFTDVDNHRIRKIDGAGIITTIAGTGVGGFSGDGGLATAAEIKGPTFVICDVYGNILFVDHQNYRIRKIDTSGIITTIAGNGSNTYSGDGSAATAAGFMDPYGVAIDLTGNVYCTDKNRIRKISTSGIITTVAGNGTNGFSGDGGLATAAQINNVATVSVLDNLGNFYIADQGNNRIRMVNSMGIISTIAGNGSYSFSGDGGLATAAAIGGAWFITNDVSGNLYISEQNNNRITKLVSQFSIFGSTSLCQGGTISLTDTTSGGSWSSSNTSVATVSTAGVVTGVSAGTSTISYTISNACGAASATKIITVNPLPSAIAGSAGVCVGANTTLTDASAGGTWSSSSSSATVDSSTGIVAGVSAGSTTITYTLPTGCNVTKAVTVNPLPTAGTISGASSVCPSATITLTDTLAVGTWSSSSISVATINSAGVVTGIASGTTTISYTITTGCGTASAIQVITVNPLPNAGSISGASSLCASATTTLTDAVAGGTWSSSSANATVGSTGLVTGVTAGTTTISYTVTTGCGTASATKVVTVNPLPNAGSISGSATVCPAGSITLTDAVSGGTWSSNNTSVATVGTSGSVTGVTAGTTTVSYTVTNGCGTATATHIITVDPLPNAGSISGASSLCPTATITLTNATTGGAWSSSSTSVATVSSAGVVTGVTSGATTISYTVTNGCGTASATRMMTIISGVSAGAIAGAASICSGSSQLYTDTASGGHWSTTNGNLEVSGTGVATGVNPGVDTVLYIVVNGCGNATASLPVTVNPMGTVSPILGSNVVCVGGVLSLTDSSAGGTWSCTNPHATVSAGVVSGITSGFDTVLYTMSNTCGTLIASLPISIFNTPFVNTISGTTSVCIGSYSMLSDSSLGGSWSSSNGNVVVSSTGGVYGIASGIDTVIYMVTNTCGTAIATHVISVNSNPNVGEITGFHSLCAGSMITLSDSISGGTWSISNGNAMIDASGILTGIAGGVDTVFYSVSNACATVSAFSVVTIYPVPYAGVISGASSVCQGGTVTLSDPFVGGAWSSTNGFTNISTTGEVTGLIAGVDTIRYTVINTCGIAIATPHVITINPLPDAGIIYGSSTSCLGSSNLLTDSIVGGSWSLSNTNATISSGMVTGVMPGVDTVFYTVTATCGSSSATRVITVSPLPNAGDITGISSLCAGSSIVLADATSGGTWSTTNGNAIVAYGTVFGTTPGLDTILYTLTNFCGSASARHPITIHGAPSVAPITGSTTVCVGGSTVLADTTLGGTWSTLGSIYATVSGSGLVSGIASGTTTISYTVSNPCGSTTSTKNIIVEALPSAGAIHGVDSLCQGSTISMADSTAGGIWSMSNAHATVTFDGNVIGLSSGVDTVRYSVVTGCGADTAKFRIVVNPLPDAGIVSITPSVCVGSVHLLTTTGAGGTWSVTNTAATLSGASIIGANAGVDTLIYSVTNTCGSAISIQAVTVDPLPNAGVVIGSDTVCSGSEITLADSVLGGSWSVANPKAFVIDGQVYGLSSGVDTIYYTLVTICGSATASKIVTVNATPDPGVISGITVACVGNNDTLSESVSGGTWSSSTLSVATVNSVGIVAALSAGSTLISYSVSNTCGAAQTTLGISVNALPSAGIINGADSVCPGNTVTLTDGTAGGSWVSSNEAVALISTSGIVGGEKNGAATIFYVVSNFCGSDTAKHDLVVINFGGCRSEVSSIPGASDITVYPNPNQGEFIINGVLSSSINSEATIEITDVLGQKVYVGAAQIKDGKINASVTMGRNFANGVFLLTVTSGNEVKVFHVVIEQ
jgi:uncharacterized protein YjdB/RPA family protein